MPLHVRRRVQHLAPKVPVPLVDRTRLPITIGDPRLPPPHHVGAQAQRARGLRCAPVEVRAVVEDGSATVVGAHLEAGRAEGEVGLW